MATTAGAEALHERRQMRKDLMEVYSSYLGDPTSPAMKMKARKLHQMYGNSGENYDTLTRHAINMLVDIGWDMPAPPKPEREAVEYIIMTLASGKA